MFRRLSLSTLLLVAGFSAGLVLSGRMRIATESRANTPPPSLPSLNLQPRGRRGRPPLAWHQSAPSDFTRIAATAVKGVANISSLQVVRAPNGPSDRALQVFSSATATRSLDRGIAGLSAWGRASSSPPTADVIITNNHAVARERAGALTVAMSGKRAIKGRVIGVDPTTDIALLKIAVKGLPVVAWGFEPVERLGEWSSRSAAPTS